MKKLIPAIAIILILAVTSPIWIFMFAGIQNTYQNGQKKEEFVTRPQHQFEELIETCKKLSSKHEDWTFLDSKSTPSIPQELTKFGFYRTLIHEQKVKLELFSSFDSGGHVICDWTLPGETKLYFVEGDYSDIITPIYKRTTGRTSPTKGGMTQGHR